MKLKHTLYGFSLVLGCIVGAYSFGSCSTHALTTQEDVDIYFTFNPTLGINLSSNNIVIDNLIPGNAAKSQNITITVSSNDAYGYKLLATAGDGADYTNNSLINGTATFTSLALNAGTALTSMGDNTWGWSKNNVDAFYGLPYYTNTPAEILSTSAAGDSITTFAIGAKAASDQATGEYNNVINFALVGNVVADTMELVNTMQDFAAMTTAQKTSVLASMPTNAVYTLIDERDNTEYKVAKLKDGKVWMLDNLALDLTDSNVQANLNSYTTNATDLSLSYLKGERTRDPSTDADGKYATAGVTTTWNTDSYSAPLINTESNDSVGTTNKRYGNGSHKYGTYYNYCAATAGSYCYGNGTSAGTSSGNATEDVCPVGWRLPTGSSSGDFQALCDELIDGTCASPQSMTASDPDSMQYILSLPLAGYYTTGGLVDGTSRGYFWSSSRTTDDNMNRLIAGDTQINLSQSTRKNGFSVRCVLR